MDEGMRILKRFLGGFRECKKEGKVEMLFGIFDIISS